MLSLFNDIFSFYIYLPEIFVGGCLLILFFFLIYDKLESQVINVRNKEVKKKYVSINNSIIILIIIILFYVLLLYFNMPSVNFEGESFAVTPLILFTKMFYVALTLLTFVLFYIHNKNVKNLSFEFFFSYFFVFFSSLLLLQSNNLISFYIVIELQSIVLYFLIAFDRASSVSAESGLKYFLMSIFMSIVFLLGVALVYLSFGTTNLSYLSLLIYKLTDFGLALYGFIFIIIFIMFKLAVVPFHFWALEVYDGSSWPVISVLSVLSKVPLVVFLIKLFLILGLDINFNSGLNFILVIFNLLGFCSIFVGTFGAVYYVNLRKILVYSGIANIGYVLLALGSSNFLVIIFSYIFFVFYSLVLILLLYLILLLFGGKYKDYTFQFMGLSVRSSSISFLFLVIFFILIGLPPLAGFWTKFLLLFGIVGAGGYFKALFIFLSNILAAVYYLRVIREMYFGKSVSNENLKTSQAGMDTLFLYCGVFLVFSLAVILLNFDLFIWFILYLFI